MAYGTTGLAAALNGVTGVATHVALNSADPGTTGASVITSVTPVTITFPTATTGSVQSEQEQLSIPGAATVTHFSLWDGPDTATANYVTGGELDGPEVFSDVGGTLNITVTLTADDA